MTVQVKVSCSMTSSGLEVQSKDHFDSVCCAFIPAHHKEHFVSKEVNCFGLTVVVEQVVVKVLIHLTANHC